MNMIEKIPHSPPMLVLVVDDTRSTLDMFRVALSQAGHSVITAASGEEAIERFLADKPDMVLMDVVLPGIGGIEATRRIRALDTGYWVPIIFVSALSQRDDMVRGLEAGGDDYLAKPVDLDLLLAKIGAMQRIAALKGKLRETNEELEAYRKASEHDLVLARELMEHMVMRSSAPVDGVELWLQPSANLSGDLVIAQQFFNDRVYLLLADAMGHGLPAALPLLPLAQVFSAMTRQGFTIPAIIREMNSLLKALLPTGNFVTATLLSIDRTNRLVEIWNGGNPPALLLDAEGKPVRKFISRHPALGILAKDGFDASTELFQWNDECWLTLYSDGLLDATNPQGAHFGDERIIASLRGNNPHQSLRKAVAAHLDGHDATDDISLATLILQ